MLIYLPHFIIRHNILPLFYLTRNSFEALQALIYTQFANIFFIAVAYDVLLCIKRTAKV